MQKIKENLLPLSLILIIPLMHTFYELLNNADRGVYSLVTDLDRVIPLVKFFVIPYVSWYFFIFITMAYFCVKDRSIYYRTLITYVIGLIICYLTYYFFQTTVPRPYLIGNDIFTRMIELIYSSDEPFNAFPSIHSFASFIMIKAIFKSSIRNRFNTFVITGTAVSIILSTLFVKQHVVLDAMGAILLGELIFSFVYNFDGVKVALWGRKPYLLSTMKKKLEGLSNFNGS